MEVGMKLPSFAPIAKKLAVLDSKIKKRVLSKSVRAGTRPVLNAARGTIPRASGRTAKSLDIKVKSYQSGAIAVGVVGQRRDATLTDKQEAKLQKTRGGISGRGSAVPIHFLENNIKPHRIPKTYRVVGRGRDKRRVRSGPLALRFGGRTVFVQYVDHPGVRGRKPLRTAADATQSQALERTQRKMTELLDAET